MRKRLPERFNNIQDPKIAKVDDNKEKHNKSAKTRLMHDYLEVKRAKDIYTVSAAPLENDIFVWHANLKGMPGTAYENAIFHLIINFPKDYPNNPPEIKLTETILHPNVFGEYLCLDILSPEKKEFSGWSSSYSVLSILLQLQAFLFVPPGEDIDFRDLKNTITSANEHKCQFCEHRPLRPYPPFNKPEDFDEKENKESLRPLEIVKTSLVCFYTRKTFEEEVLGAGIKLRTNRRTGKILSLLPTFDWVSNKAYMRYNVRKSANNITFTHWIPIYINEKHAEKAFHLAKRSIAYICTGNVDDFQPSQILDVYCSIISSCVVQIMKQNIFASSKAIEFLYQMERMFIEFAIRYPEITEIARYKIQKFIEDPKERHKDSVSSLGEFMSMLLIVPDFKWSQVVKALLDESLSRGAFWIVNNYPSLANDVDKTNFTEEEINSRLSKCFSTSSVGIRFICFQKFLQTKLLRGEEVKSLKEIAQLYDKRYSFPEENTLELIKKEISNLFSTIVDYPSYFKYLELGFVMSDPQINSWLITSQKLAVEKGYFNEAEVSTLGDYEDILNLNSPSLDKLINDKGELLGEDNDVWQKLLTSKIWHYAPTEYHKKMLREKGYSSRKQYLYLYLQQYIKLLPTNKDFQGFVQTLQLVKNDITELEINLLDDNKFTSKSFYIQLLLKNLTNLTSFTIASPSFFNEKIDAYDGSYSGAMKGRTLIALCKGIASSSGKLEKLQILGYSIQITKQFIDTLLSKNCSNLKSLAIDGFYFENQFMNLAEFFELKLPSITELTINNYAEVFDKTRDIKTFHLRNLNILTLNSFRPTANFFSSLINQLCKLEKFHTFVLKSFSINGFIEYEKKHVLDFRGQSEILFDYEKQVRESFSKLFSTSKSLTTINLAKSNLNLCQSHTHSKRKTTKHESLLEIVPYSFKNLFQGKSKTLKNILLDNITFYSEDLISVFVGFPSLQILSLSSVIIDHKLEGNIPFDLPKNITLHLNTMNGHLQTYFVKNANKFFNCAKELDLKSTTIFYPIERDNIYKAISSKDCNVSILNLRKVPIGAEHMKNLCDALSKNTSITSLDLSKVGITANSCSFISEFLKVHPKLVKLNLFSNKIEVNGCKYLAESLKLNPPLQFLDIGSNKIKNKGVGFISSALSTNKNLKEISIRYNRITGPTCLNFTASCILHPSVEKISIARNILSDDNIDQIFKLINSPFQHKNTLGIEGIGDLEISSPKEDISENNNKKRKNKTQSIDPQRKILVSESKKKKLITDLDGYLNVLDFGKQERTVIIPDVPSHITPFFLKQRIEEEKCGVVENLQIMKKTKQQQTKVKRSRVSQPVSTNWIAFVRFIEVGSVDRLLHLFHKRIDLFRSKESNEKEVSQQGTMSFKVDRSKKKVNKNRSN